ncbi:hypothetical protein P7C71_g3956, partial [Lecanoromycetidae sp. Uapishka_2]
MESSPEWVKTNSPPVKTFQVLREDLEEDNNANSRPDYKCDKAVEQPKYTDPKADDGIEPDESCGEADSGQNAASVDIGMQCAMAMVQRLQAENDELKSKSKERDLGAQSEQDGVSREDSAFQIDALRQELGQQQFALQQMETSYNTLCSEFASANVDKAQLQGRLDSLLKEKDDLYEKALVLWRQLSSDPEKQTYIELESKIQEVNSLKTQVNDLQTNLEIRVHESQILQRAISFLASKEHWMWLREKYIELQNTYPQISERWRESQEECTALKAELSIREELILQLEEKVESGTALYNSQKAELYNLVEKHDKLWNKYDNLEQDHEALEENHGKLQGEVDDLKGQAAQDDYELRAFGAHSFERLVKLHLTLLNHG